MEFEDSNRAFVQAFLARNVLTFEEARPILVAIFSIHEKKDVPPSDIGQNDFASMISAANDALSPLDFEIRSGLHQETRERYYALVNTTSDALTQIATIHNSDEIGYIKRLLDEMFEANNTKRREAMCIAGKDAVNLVKAGRRETQTATQSNGDGQAKWHLGLHEAESLLSQLIAEGWLEKSPKGFYSLSPRAFMELKSWLMDTYNDDENEVYKIKTCEACKEIVTVGQRCSTQDCLVRLHNICTQAFWRMHRDKACPKCKTRWDGEHYVGEKAITTSESYTRGQRRSGARPRDADEAASEDEQ